MQDKKNFWRAGLLTWLALPPLAFVNAALREWLWQPVFGHRAAEWIAVVLLVALSVIVAYALLRAHRDTVGATRLWGLGAVWAGLTVAFETALFGVVMGYTADELLAAYDVRGGSLWSLVVIGVFAAPRIAGRLIAGPPRTAAGS